MNRCGRKSRGLKPWTRGPLYLADGEEKQPLGMSEIHLVLQHHPVTLPCLILPACSLAFSVVVELDLIFLSGLQMDVSERSYCFKSNQKCRYHFLEETTAGHLAFFSAAPPRELLSLPSSQSLLKTASEDAHLDEFGKNQLLCQLQGNTDVCTATLECAGVLSHKTFLTHNVPIKQKPYRVSPTKSMWRKC